VLALKQGTSAISAALPSYILPSTHENTRNKRLAGRFYGGWIPPRRSGGRAMMKPAAQVAVVCCRIQGKHGNGIVAQLWR
jgi:hypothetical protein